MKLIFKFLINVIAILAIAKIIPGIYVKDLKAAFLTAIVLFLVYTFIRPLLVLLTLPINLLTLGLFTLIINGFLFWFTSYFINGFNVDNFLAGFLGAFAMTIITRLLDRVID